MITDLSLWGFLQQWWSYIPPLAAVWTLDEHAPRLNSTPWLLNPHRKMLDPPSSGHARLPHILSFGQRWNQFPIFVTCREKAYARMRLYFVVWQCFAIPLNRDKDEYRHSTYFCARHGVLFQINTKPVFWKNSWFTGLVHFGTNLAITDTQFREPCYKHAQCHYDMAHLTSRMKKVASRIGG